jgi:hypothetical protein
VCWVMAYDSNARRHKRYQFHARCAFEHCALAARQNSFRLNVIDVLVRGRSCMRRGADAQPDSGFPHINARALHVATRTAAAQDGHRVITLKRDDLYHGLTSAVTHHAKIVRP